MHRFARRQSRIQGKRPVRPKKPDRALILPALPVNPLRTQQLALSNQAAQRLAAQITPIVQRQVEQEEEEESIQARPINSPIQRQEDEPEEEKEEPIQAKQVDGHVPYLVPGLTARVQALRGGGRPLPALLRSFFEPRFGCDFGRVRIHTDARAAEVARALNARAFTRGTDVVFGAGQYAPGTAAGRQLLSHELSHVVQQKGISPAGSGQKGDGPAGRGMPMVQLAPVRTGRHTAVVRVRWSWHTSTFFQRLIRAVSRNRAFRGIPSRSLWQPFSNATRRFHGGVGTALWRKLLVKGKQVRFRVSALYTPGRYMPVSDVQIQVISAVTSGAFQVKKIPKPRKPKVPWIPSPPWTMKMLKAWREKELKGEKLAWRRMQIRQKFFAGMQVVRHWKKRYGRWDRPMDEWTYWLYDNMIRGYYPKQLWRNFLAERARKGGHMKQKVYVKPWGQLSALEKMKTQFLYYTYELESRDPTSVEFHEPYTRYIKDPKNPTLVEPPAGAQTYLIDGKKYGVVPVVSNNKLRDKISDLRKKLLRAGVKIRE